MPLLSTDVWIKLCTFKFWKTVDIVQKCMFVYVYVYSITNKIWRKSHGMGKTKRIFDAIMQ